MRICFANDCVTDKDLQCIPLVSFAHLSGQDFFKILEKMGRLDLVSYVCYNVLINVCNETLVCNNHLGQMIALGKKWEPSQILAKYGYEKSTDKQDVLNSILEYDSEEYGSARRQKIKLENDFVISLL